MLKSATLFDLAGVPLELPPDVVSAVQRLSESPSEDRGAVFTKAAVVNFMLDLVGWRADFDLSGKTMLEPSFGGGDFLIPITMRLLNSMEAHGHGFAASEEWLIDSVRAVELHRDSMERTREKLLATFHDFDVPRKLASRLLKAWLICDDFLLSRFDHQFDFVVGNPPYLRQERIPAELLSEYKSRFSTIYDRADLYIPFIEHSLDLLSESGKQCFICNDRWMKNKYGGPLRAIVARSFHLSAYVNMFGIDAFHHEVTAYPAITLISRADSGPTRIATIEGLEEEKLQSIVKELTAKTLKKPKAIQQLDQVVSGSQPWILDASPSRALVHRLESEFVPLEEAGCKVGIGVATGADKMFIAPFDAMDVEDTRKLPLAMTKDIANGTLQWKGLGVLNPFESDGKLADLEAYPRFKSYLESRKSIIQGRHVAKKNPTRWYRTIDRIYPELVEVPKLLIPDIKGEANIVYDKGTLYPHHNLYYITSEEWDLRALQLVLQSGIATLFVSSYTTKMRGGCYRFQAQYLRKIRLPRWNNVPAAVKSSLIKCAHAKKIDWDKAAELICKLYCITGSERDYITWNQKDAPNAD